MMSARKERVCGGCRYRQLDPLETWHLDRYACRCMRCPNFGYEVGAGDNAGCPQWEAQHVASVIQL